MYKVAHRAIYTVVREIVLTSRERDQNSLRSSKAKSATAIILFASRNRTNSIRRHYRSTLPSIYSSTPPFPLSGLSSSLFLFALSTLGFHGARGPDLLCRGFPGKLARHLLTSWLTSLTCEMGSSALSLSSSFSSSSSSFSFSFFLSRLTQRLLGWIIASYDCP